VQGQDGPQQPFELVRSLRTLQDRIAQGDLTAHAAQRKLVAQIADEMAAADLSVWSDARNVRAAVVYALSGGEPRALKPLFRVPSLSGVDDKLLNGALAYSEGRTMEAAELLAGVDPRALEPSLGGHVALVKSALVAAEDPGSASALLDDARLLAPGTLIEEAALRRQAFLVASAGDVERFDSLASQYLRRFARSAYAGSFRELYAAEVAGERYAAERLPKLEAMLQEVEVSIRRQFYVSIAREAVLRGRLELARLAAGHSARLSEEESVARLRSRLYEAAAAVATLDIEQGRTSLERIDRSKLDQDDVALLDAAITLAAEVARLPEPADIAADEPPPAAARSRYKDAERVAATLQTIKMARRALAQVDQILTEVSK
jgi:chemotaxis protein MotC